MQAAKDQFDRRKVSVAIVSFAEPERLAMYQTVHQWPFPIFADPERDAYRHFGLERLPWYRVFSPPTLKFYAGMLLKGKRLENYGRDDYRQSGGDFIVDGSGNMVFAYHSHDPADRPPVQTLLAAIDSVSPRSRQVL